ncbi:hemolysin activation protein [Escherichia coli]|nr:hemolysin activation protein [Escherichia coli]
MILPVFITVITGHGKPQPSGYLPSQRLHHVQGNPAVHQ